MSMTAGGRRQLLVVGSALVLAILAIVVFVAIKSTPGPTPDAPVSRFAGYTLLEQQFLNAMVYHDHLLDADDNPGDFLEAGYAVCNALDVGYTVPQITALVYDAQPRNSSYDWSDASWFVEQSIVHLC